MWGTHPALTASAIFVIALLVSSSGLALAESPSTDHVEAAAGTQRLEPPMLVIGFVGGFVHSDDERHSEVQLARHLRATYGERVQVEVFKNRHRAQAYEAARTWLNSAGKNEEKRQRRRIILFGHSWGASAVVYLARDLQRDNIPVSLTIQVDSIRKHGEDDSLIPANVAEAINFYQSRGIIHGRSLILAADPSRTSIVGNLKFDYRKQPAECQSYPWYDRLFFKGHTSIECDPQVWSQVETLIKTHLNPAAEPAETKIAGKIGE